MQSKLQWAPTPGAAASASADPLPGFQMGLEADILAKSPI